MNTTTYEFTDEITDEEADYMTDHLQVTTLTFHEMSKYTVTTEDELNWLIKFCSGWELIIGEITLPSKVIIIHVENKTYILNPNEAKQMLNAHTDEILS